GHPASLDGSHDAVPGDVHHFDRPGRLTEAAGRQPRSAPPRVHRGDHRRTDAGGGRAVDMNDPVRRLVDLGHEVTRRAGAARDTGDPDCLALRIYCDRADHVASPEAQPDPIYYPVRGLADCQRDIVMRGINLGDPHHTGPRVRGDAAHRPEPADLMRHSVRRLADLPERAKPVVTRCPDRVPSRVDGDQVDIRADVDLGRDSLRGLTDPDKAARGYPGAPGPGIDGDLAGTPADVNVPDAELAGRRHADCRQSLVRGAGLHGAPESGHGDGSRHGGAR